MLNDRNAQTAFRRLRVGKRPFSGVPPLVDCEGTAPGELLLLCMFMVV